MAQLAIGKFEVDGGYGKSTIHMTPVDLATDPMSPTGDLPFSYVHLSGSGFPRRRLAAFRRNRNACRFGVGI